MQKKAFLFTILTLLLVTEVFSQKLDQFAGISFGLNRQEVIEEIMKLGYDPYGQVGSASDRVIIPVYMLAELPVQVDFLFNKNEKFYAFEIRTGRMEQLRLNKVFDAVAYMSDHFTVKYGKPSKAPSLQEQDIKVNVHNIYQEWFGVKFLDIYTAIIQKMGVFIPLVQSLTEPLPKKRILKAKRISLLKKEYLHFSFYHYVYYSGKVCANPAISIISSRGISSI